MSEKEGVDIFTMDTEKSPTQTTNCVEFILLTLCKALKVKPKQAATLLTKDNLYLSEACVKGTKGGYEPMI